MEDREPGALSSRFADTLLWAAVLVGFYYVARANLSNWSDQTHRLTVIGLVLPDRALKSLPLSAAAKTLYYLAAALWLGRLALPLSAWLTTAAYLVTISLSIESQHYTRHEPHIVAQFLIILCAYHHLRRRPLAEARRGPPLRALATPDWVHGLCVAWLAISYSLSGLTKLRYSGLGWADGYGVSLAMIAYRVPAWAQRLAPFAAFGQPLVLAAELASAGIVLSQRFRWVWGAVMTAFHLFMLTVFGLEFYANVLLLPLVCFWPRPATVRLARADDSRAHDR